MESNYQFESIPQIQSSILTSFLDDSSVELCCDDERLRVFIQSLEAEINPILMNDQGNNISDDEEQISSSSDDTSAPTEDVLDFVNWMDSEMLSPCCCSSSSSISSDVDVDDDDELSWYDQVSGDDELDLSYMIEYGAAVIGGDYSSEIPMEMDMDLEMVMEEHIYTSLWQENYDLQSCTSQYS